MISKPGRLWGSGHHEGFQKRCWQPMERGEIPKNTFNHLTPQWLMEIVATNFTTVAMTHYPSDISDANDISHLIFLTHLIHLTPIWSTTRLGLCPLDPQLAVKVECQQLSQGSFTFVKLKDNNFHIKYYIFWMLLFMCHILFAFFILIHFDFQVECKYIIICQQ